MERMLIDLLFVVLGMVIGIGLMCLLQAGKKMDRYMEEMDDRRNGK